MGQTRMGALQARHGVFHLTRDLVVPVLHHLDAQLALARKVGEDGGLRDACLLRDHGHRCPLVAVRREHPTRSGQQVLLPQLGFGAPGCGAGEDG